MNKTAARLAVIVLAGGMVTGGSVASAHGSCTGTLLPSQATVTTNNQVGATGTVTCQWVHDIYRIDLAFEYRNTPGTGQWQDRTSFSRSWNDANSETVSYSRSVFCPASVREWRISMDWSVGGATPKSGSLTLSGVIVCL